MKRDTFYFSHDYSARNDPKLKRLLREHGVGGLGVFWCIIEELYEQGGKLSLDYIETIAWDLHVDVSMIKNIIDGYNLFKTEDDFFWSESVMARLQKRENANEKRRQKQKEYQERKKSEAPAPQSQLPAIAESKPKTKRERKPFVPPTVEELAVYIAKRKSPIDPETFWNFYESKGWMVGKNKMTSWKAAVSTWERKEKEKNGNKVINQNGVSDPGFGIER